MENDGITLDLRTIWILIRKNILLIIALFITGGLGAYFVSAYLITPQYEASMTLVVNTREEQTITITGDQINSARQLVNTYAVILTNDTLLDDIIRKFSLDDTPATLKKRISTGAVNQTQVLLVTVRDKNTDTAEAILNEIMEQAEDLLMTTVKAGSVEIVSPPRVSDEPVSPRVLLNTAIGAASGIFLAFVIIFIKRAMTNTFISDEDVTANLGLPVLGVIPSLSAREAGRYSKGDGYYGRY